MPIGDIYAVIWCDFIPLHLPQPDADAAVNYAREMHARATIAGITLHDLRAVKLPADRDELETLWRPDAADPAPMDHPR